MRIRLYNFDVKHQIPPNYHHHPSLYTIIHHHYYCIFIAWINAVLTEHNGMEINYKRKLYQVKNHLIL